MTPDQIIHVGLTLLIQLASHFFTKDKIKDVSHDIRLVKNQVSSDLAMAQTKLDQATTEVSKVVQAVQDSSSSTPTA